MLSFSLKLTKKSIARLQKSLKAAEQIGDLTKVKRIMSVMMMAVGDSISKISMTLGVSSESVRNWL